MRSHPQERARKVCIVYLGIVCSAVLYTQRLQGLAVMSCGERGRDVDTGGGKSSSLMTRAFVANPASIAFDERQEG